MSFYHDIFTITVQGAKASIIRMLNAAIRNMGSGEVISENDDIETVCRKSNLCVSYIDFIDEEGLNDRIVQGKKQDFDKMVEYYQNVRDGKVSFGPEEDEEAAMYKADEVLDEMTDGRFNGIIGVSDLGSEMLVQIEHYLGEEVPPYPDWIDWADICRIYDVQIVVDDMEYRNGGFNDFCGATIYQMKDGIASKTRIEPKLDVLAYTETVEKLSDMDPSRFRWKCIKDLELNIEKLQLIFSREKLLAACESLDPEDGRLVVPDGLTKIDLDLVLSKYRKARYSHLKSYKSHRDKIKSIYIPESVDCISYIDSIPGSNIEAIEVSPDNKSFCSLNNCVLSKDKKVLIIGCKGSVIPDCVTEIGHYAFRECEGLEKITIPSNVQKIGREAFSRCANLKELVIENGVQEVFYGAFQYCTSLNNVVLPDSIRNLSARDFEGCTALSEESLPKDQKVAYNEFGDGFIYGGGVEKDESLPF